MMATKKRKHVNKVLKEDILNELINDSGPTEQQKITDDSISTLNSNNEIERSEVSGEREEKTEDKIITINSIVEHYHKKLYENDLATGYLKSKGITNPEIWSIFKIGFCDRSLKNRLSKKQIEECKKYHLIGEDGEESLKNSFVFPVFDEVGQVICLYGLNIDTDKETAPLYFTDNKDGSAGDTVSLSNCSPTIIFNYKAFKVYDEIILTKDIIEALSLMTIGFQNIICICDDIKFSHIQKLKENRVKKIIIAYGSNYSEQLRADLLKNMLVEECFTVRMIYPKGSDTWNEALLNGMDKEYIKLIIGAEKEYRKDASTWLSMTGASEKFKVKNENGLYIFLIDNITYQLAGIKDIYSNNLKIKIRIESEQDHHRDSIDLYAYRSRQNFAGAAANKLNINAVRIGKDLEKILDYFENEQKKGKDKSKNDENELTEEEKELGLSFLKSPDIDKKIIDDITTLGYVGEDLNKLLLYLCATSRLTENPISILIISQSATGKSYLVDIVKKLIPKNEVITIHSLSDQALNYIRDLIGKFLAFGEAIFNPEVERQIREMLSSKELTRMIAEKDDKTGEIIGKIISKEVNIACVMSTTTYKVHPENASRFFIINADESAEQTRKIYNAQVNKYSPEREYIKTNVIPGIIKKHNAVQRLLKKQVIIIPDKMRNVIKFPDKLMRLRRDHERFIDLIAVVCFLRQYQKELKNNGDVKYIECDEFDYAIAYELFVKGALKSTISELPQQAVILYEEIRKMVKDISETERLKVEEVSFTQRELREFSGFSQMYIKRYIKVLVEFEYLKTKGSQSRGSRQSYSLIADETLNGIDISMIPKPGEIEKALKE